METMEIMSMMGNFTWELELAIWTLKHILPKEYPKYNDTSILNSAVDYIERLSEKLQTIRWKTTLNDQQRQCNSDGSEADRDSFQITDEEEIELLSSLGLNKNDDMFVGAQPEWLEAISVKSEYIFSDDEINYFNSPKLQQCDSKVKRPGNGFIRFSTEKRKEVLRAHPKFDNRQVSKILGVMWRKLTPLEKKPYIDQFVDHINVIRIAHPEWNYAASRAKSVTSSNKNSIVLEQRLRLRNGSPKYVNQQEESYIEEHIPRSKPKLKKKSKGKSKKRSLDNEIIAWVNCDVCDKWRKIPADINVDSLPIMWVCSMNTDPQYNSCDKDQENE